MLRQKDRHSHSHLVSQMLTSALLTHSSRNLRFLSLNKLYLSLAVPVFLKHKWMSQDHSLVWINNNDKETMLLKTITWYNHMTLLKIPVGKSHIPTEVSLFSLTWKKKELFKRPTVDVAAVHRLNTRMSSQDTFL